MASERSVAWFAVRSRRPGPTRSGVEAIVADRPGLDPVLVELARSTADLVDSAKRQQDPAVWLRASERLLSIHARLGASGDRGDSAAAGAAGGVSPLAGIVGGPPEVRDASAPGAADVRAEDPESR